MSIYHALYSKEQLHVFVLAFRHMARCLVYVHAFFLGCFAMDSDCSLRGMPSAEWDSGRVHALSAPLSSICWAWLLPLPAALGGNIQHSNDLQTSFHIMPTFVRSCMPCHAEIFWQLWRMILYLCWVSSLIRVVLLIQSCGFQMIQRVPWPFLNERKK